MDEQSQPEQRIRDVQQYAGSDSDACRDGGAPPVIDTLLENDGEIRAGARDGQQVG